MLRCVFIIASYGWELVGQRLGQKNFRIEIYFGQLCRLVYIECRGIVSQHVALYLYTWLWGGSFFGWVSWGIITLSSYGLSPKRLDSVSFQSPSREEIVWP